MNSIQGKPLTLEVRRVVVSVKLYFDSIKISPKESSSKRAADAIGIGEATVKRIMASYNKDPKSLDNCIKMRGRPPHLVGETNQELVRDYVRTANKNGEYITLNDIKEFLKKNTLDDSL